MMSPVAHQKANGVPALSKLSKRRQQCKKMAAAGIHGIIEYLKKVDVNDSTAMGIVSFPLFPLKNKIPTQL